MINITNTYTPFGTLTKIHGPHTFKIGASSVRTVQLLQSRSSPEGLLVFDGSITNQGNGESQHRIADLLLGKIKNEATSNPIRRRAPELQSRHLRSRRLEGTPKLTLNVGIRYEYESPLTICKQHLQPNRPQHRVLFAAGLNVSLIRSTSPTPKGRLFRRESAWPTA